MNKIKIQVLDPTGIPIHEIETNYNSDQLDRFLSQNRIVVLSDEKYQQLIEMTPEKKLPNMVNVNLNQNKDKDE